MPDTLVIGYGNTLRRDDGIGPIAVQQVALCLRDEAAECLSLPVLTPDLAERCSEVQRVIFVDARADGVPGEITWVSVLPAKVIESGLGHDLSPMELIAFAEILYGTKPGAELVTVGGADFSTGEGLSALVEAVMPRLVTEIVCRVKGHQDSDSFPG